VARRVEHLDREAADSKNLAIGEQPVELAAIARDVGRVEDRTKYLLDVADVLADADFGAGLELDVGRSGQVVGVGMGLEHPIDSEPRISRGREDLVG